MKRTSLFLQVIGIGLIALMSSGLNGMPVMAQTTKAARSLSTAGTSSEAHQQQKQRTLEGRDYIESTSYNEAQRGTVRTLQYYPEGDGFVSVGGKNRYTRALYGPHTPFRVETSDVPVFAIYNKPKSWHIDLRLHRGKESVALDSMDTQTRAIYRPGKREYLVRKEDWGTTLQVEVIALYDKEAAVWKIQQLNPQGSPVSSGSTTQDTPLILEALCSSIRATHLNRSGDMGADPADSFEASLTESVVTSTQATFENQTCYLYYENDQLCFLPLDAGETLFNTTEQERVRRTSTFRIETPDPYINTLGGALLAAADGIWNGEVWLHGANGWRMPLSGWRAAYVGDCLGWYDRARAHFDHYAASQVTDVPTIYAHPRQDTLMNLARAEKRWGTPMYSNGYICRNPERNNQMHHYDMNLCYVDELLSHLCWTGDTAYARLRWPLLTSHLAWEKRNFDPNNDGLYDAYCCIWASDALYYNSGAVTHASAYNYRANRMAAEIATLIGEDPKPYIEEAALIRKAMQQQLWMDPEGCWAEFKDFMGHQLLHRSPGVWTIYHAIDSEVSNPFAYYRATRYIDREIPHLKVEGVGLHDEGYETISTTNWLPYSWSINNVAFAEVYHTALAYWQAQRPEEAFRLFKSALLDGMYLGNSPGNFGQLSFYDAARGECYRDFGDPIGTASRAVVQGLFGIQPDLLHERVSLRPGFPASWNFASLHARYIDFTYQRIDSLSGVSQGCTERYLINPHFARKVTVTLTFPARREHCLSARINGKQADLKEVVNDIGAPLWSVELPNNTAFIEVALEWEGAPISNEKAIPVDTATVASKIAQSPRSDTDNFELVSQGSQCWWREKSVQNPATNSSIGEDTYGTILPKKSNPSYQTIPLSNVWNARVTDIFQNRYDAPRSPYTTLQIPRQGIGEWCHPKETATIDDSGFRQSLNADGIFVTPQGIPFQSTKEGKNIAYTSLWDNYPDSLQLPLSGKASGIYLLLAGSTNHMQCHLENGRVTVRYTDGSAAYLPLINPENWAPIEQALYLDGKAFCSKAPLPQRLLFASGTITDNPDAELSLKGFNDRRIPGGAGTLLFLPLNPKKKLHSMTLETRANEVVIGLLGATLLK